MVVPTKMSAFMVFHTLCQQTVHVSLMPNVLQSIMATLGPISESDPHQIYGGRLVLQFYDVRHTAIIITGRCVPGR